MTTKPPPIDFDKAVKVIDATRKDRARVLQGFTNEQLVDALEEAVKMIDVYGVARKAGDTGAEVYLMKARKTLLSLMGIS